MRFKSQQAASNFMATFKRLFHFLELISFNAKNLNLQNHEDVKYRRISTTFKFITGFMYLAERQTL